VPVSLAHRCPCISSFLDPGSSPWDDSYHGSTESASPGRRRDGSNSWTTGHANWLPRVGHRRPDCSVWWDGGHSPKPVGRSLILTAEKRGFVPIGERTWDNGGHVHESGLLTCADTCLQPAVPVAVAVQLAARLCRSGHFEEDGSDPPLFASRIGTAGPVDVHCRAIAWGVAPVPNIPGGKATERVGSTDWISLRVSTFADQGTRPVAHPSPQLFERVCGPVRVLDLVLARVSGRPGVDLCAPRQSEEFQRLLFSQGVR
jgi:hypothetical protein